MKPRFFIDECLSAALAATAKERGFHADFGPHIGMAGWQDWNIARFAYDNDYVVVTNNRRHFLRQYASYDLHNGLIVIVPQGDRDLQVRLFSHVLGWIAAKDGSTINMVFEMLSDATMHARTWTSEDHDPDHIGTPAWLAGRTDDAP